MKQRLDDEELLQYILENFTYSDGNVIRHDRKNSEGSYDKDGYLIMKIKGRQVKAHRVVFALIHGRFPNGEIDHINGVRDDNRIENLRECLRYENVLNSHHKVNSDTGVEGVYIDKTDGLKKNCVFHFRGKTYRFYTVEEAIAAKEQMRKEYYGTFYRREA